jgi:adenine-specific DNA-methyltransferase
MPTLHFKGKPLVQNHHLAVPFSELELVKSRSVGKAPSLHDNLIIEGDNLKALKALLPAYHGKVKCIYIDPPYNTGNEGWIYNDRVNSPMMRDWLGRTVDRDDLTRHDKWCCMMLPRLKLLRELLTDDGAIFVSIDDNEVHRLRCLMDEVFGEENFIEAFVWKKSYGGGAKERFAVRQHEYCLMFARNAEKLGELWLPPDVSAVERYYKYRDKKFKERGPHRIKPLEASKSMDTRKNLVFAITAPDGTKVMPRRQWWWRRERVEQAVENDELVFTKTKAGWSISYKQYLRDDEGVERGKKPFSIIDGIYTQAGTDALYEIFEKIVLQFPKPPQFVQQLIRMTTSEDPTAIILDSFAGSGTTAHAVLALNKEDGGDRRFILCQMPHETKEQEKKKENICESITAERVRRVIRGIPKAKDENLRSGLGGTFSYFKLGRELEKQAILDGKDLPGYEALAGYVFWTATGEEFQPKKMKPKQWFIGESREYAVFLIYDNDLEKLKDMALTLDIARALPEVKGKRKLVFAPTKYLDDDFLTRLQIEFCQLPFEIYEAAEEK